MTQIIHQDQQLKGMEQTRIYLGQQCRKEAQQIRLLSFERPVYKVGHWQASGTWNLGRFTPFPELLLTGLKLCVQNNTIYVKHQLSSGSLEFCYVSDRDCRCDQPLGNELLWCDNILYMLSQLVIGEIKHTLCDFTGRKLWKLEPGFPRTSLNSSLLFTDCALYSLNRNKSCP